MIIKLLSMKIILKYYLDKEIMKVLITHMTIIAQRRMKKEIIKIGILNNSNNSITIIINKIKTIILITMKKRKSMLVTENPNSISMNLNMMMKSIKTKAINTKKMRMMKKKNMMIHWNRKLLIYIKNDSFFISKIQCIS